MCQSVDRDESVFETLNQINFEIRNHQSIQAAETNHLSSIARLNANNRSNSRGQDPKKPKPSERYLILSQILLVKITIVVLLIQIESLKSAQSVRGWTLFASLMIAFLAMHSFYDKYHSRYSTGPDRRGSRPPTSL